MRKTISFDGLEQRHPGLTQAVAANYAEAAHVCLDRHHNPPLPMGVSCRSTDSTLEANWQPTTEVEKIAWANADDATRDGAYAVSLAVVEEQERLVAVGRAWTRTGADYFVAPLGTERGDFENATRLEVSGVDKGDWKLVKGRLIQKLEQARRGDSDKPAMAAVIGFKAAVVLYEHMDSE